MTDSVSNRDLQIEQGVIGSSIISGDGNTVHVIYQVTEQRQEASTKEDAPTAIGPNPYKGLAAFKEEDADRYFGREAQVERLWQRFQDLAVQSQQPRLLPILGPSGCGKSSLARAGLIPELARRPLPGKEQLRVAVFVPGSHPIEALAAVLAKAATQDPMPATKTREFATELRVKNADGGYDGLRRIVDLMPQIQDSPLVLLIDQFEEVFSLCQDGEERTALIQTLLDATADPTGNLAAILTLRSDFIGETQRHPALNQIVASDQSAIVPAMSEAELRRAIAEPAQQAGHPLDDALVDLLVKDTEGRDGALPLLQFALSRIWQGLSEGKSPAYTYRQMGGVGGALAGKAQEIYDQLTDAEKDIARRVFVGLVQLGEGTRDTRRRATLESLLASQDNPETVKQIIDRFAKPGARLVTLASDTEGETAEVTHEALFDHWQQLNDWLDRSRDDIRFQRRLEAAAAYWQQQGYPNGLLWRLPDLDLLRSFVQTAMTDLPALSLEFFQASDRAEKQAKRLRRFGVIGLALGFVLMTGLSTFAGYQVQRAERRRMELYEARANDLADDDKLQSLILGLAAIGLGRSAFVKLPNLQRDGLVSSSVLDWANRSKRFSYVAGHADWVTSAAFSPNGHMIVSGSNDGTIRLWDLAGNPIGSPFQGHSDSVISVAFSPNGQTIASGSSDGMIRLWDLAGNPIGNPFQGHSDSVNSVAFSPNGQMIVSSSRDGGTIRLWNLTGNPISEIFQGYAGSVMSVTLSPDGQTIVSGSNDGTIRLWDLAGNPIGNPFQGHMDLIWSVAFSPDGQMIVSSGYDRRIRLWTLDGRLLGETSQSHSDAVSLAFSPDGQTLASGSRDGTIRLWDLMGNSIGDPFQGHKDLVSSVAFSPDGQALVSSSGDGTIRLWTLDSNPIGDLFQGHAGSVSSVAFSPDGQMIVSGSNDGTIRLWDLVGNSIGNPFQGHADSVISVDFSPDGQMILSGSYDRTLRLWTLDGSPIGNPFRGHEDWIGSVAFSPDGQTIISSGRDGTIRLWDLTGNPIGDPFQGHADSVRSVAFSPDGQNIVSGSFDEMIRLWDLVGNSIGNPFQGHADSVMSVDFSPDGQTIVSGSGDGMIRLWDLVGNSIGNPFQGHADSVMSVAFSPNSQMIVSGSRDGTIRLWDLVGNPIYNPFQGHAGSVNSVAFSPDGQNIVSGGNDGTLRLWPLWLAEEGWISYTCKRLRGYLLVRSETDEVAREARRACERYAWRRGGK